MPDALDRAMTRLPAMRAAVTLVAWLDRRSPRLAGWARRGLANVLVPFNRSAGIRVVEVAEAGARVVVRLAPRGSNRNAAGTVHGGVILALAETAHGVAVQWHFAPGAHRMFTKCARIDYRTPGRGELFVAYDVPPDLLRRIERDLAASSRSEVTMDNVVTDSRGQTVAALHATYVVQRRPGAERAPPDGRRPQGA